MAKGEILDIFNSNLEEDKNYSHITKEVKKSKKSKSTTSFSDKILSPNQHSLFFRKEKRRGKTVTMVGDFYLSTNDKKSLLKKIKISLATGGTIQDNFLEFQGEVSKKLKDILIQDNFRFKS